MIHYHRMLIIAVMAMLMTSLCLVTWSQPALTYSNAELDEILAPIALYPDPLIAQILPAATFPDQLVEADDLIRQRGGFRDIDRQDWDVSVKAVAHYPSVLHRMVNNPEWTIALGQAYVDEPTHVMWSIQRLRLRARRLGNLSTNRYQRVYVESGYYRVVPVQPQYVYVPEYSPQVVYVERRSSFNSNLISFGLGLLIGAWLNRDVDWHHDRVYYHGWNGGGWIGQSRRYVSTTNNYYVNNDYRNRPIAVDPRVRTRDLGDYRAGIRRNAGTFSPPQSRPPSRPTTARSRTMPPGGPAIGRNAPGGPRGSNRGVVVPGSTGSANRPSVAPSPRPSRPGGRPSTGPSQGVTRRGPIGRPSAPSVRPSPRSSRPVIRGNARPSQGMTRRAPVARPSTPSFRPSPRPSRPGGRPNPGPRQGMTRRAPTARPSQGVARRGPVARPSAPSVRPSRGPSHAPGRSGPGPNGGDHGHSGRGPHGR